MNDNDTRDRRDEVGALGYYKVFAVHMERHSFIWKWIWRQPRCPSPSGMDKYTLGHLDTIILFRVQKKELSSHEKSREIFDAY